MTAICYVETTIPEGLTISEYRRSRPQRVRRFARLRRLVKARRSTAA